MSIRILGREEDAVDNFANMVMIHPENGVVADDMAIAAAEGWLLTHDAYEESGATPNAYMGTHSPDLQRGYNMYCQIIGSDPNGWAALASHLGFGEDRITTCTEEFLDRNEDWRQSLTLASRNISGGRFVLRFDPAYSQRTRAAREFVTANHIFSDALAKLAQQWPPGIDVPVTFKDCDGDSNAYWLFDENAVIFCYELINEFEDLLKQ